MRPSKEFIKGHRIGQTFLGTFFGVLSGFFLIVCPWLLRILQKTNGTFEYVYAQKTGRMPAPYMYVVFWIVLLFIPKLLFVVLQLVLPESMLSAIDSILGWTVTIALIIAFIAAARK